MTATSPYSATRSFGILTGREVPLAPTGFLGLWPTKPPLVPMIDMEWYIRRGLQTVSTSGTHKDPFSTGPPPLAPFA